MIDFLLAIVGFILLVTVLVAIHEYGHFVVARAARVFVITFSIGFGKPLWKRTLRSGTDFQISMLPFGGYVKLLSEHEYELTERTKPYAIESKSPLWQIAVYAAGPAANILFALVAFCLIFMIGMPTRPAYVGTVVPNSPAYEAGIQPGDEILAVDGATVKSWYDVQRHTLGDLNETTTYEITTQDGVHRVLINEWFEAGGTVDFDRTLGIQQGWPPIIASTQSLSPAAEAGLLPGDRIISVDGLPIASWIVVVDRIRSSPGKSIQFVVERESDTRRFNRKAVTVVPDSFEANDGIRRGWVGIEVEPPVRIEKYGPLEAIPYALSETWYATTLTVTLIGKLVTGQMSVDSLAGPIGIAQMSGSSLQSSAGLFLMVMALVSISLAIFNLIPLPILDGGKIVFALIEWVTGSPTPYKIQVIGTQISLITIALLFAFVVYVDLSRILN